MTIALHKNALTVECTHTLTHTHTHTHTVDAQPDNAVIDAPECVVKILDYAAKVMNQHAVTIQVCVCVCVFVYAVVFVCQCVYLCAY
jgi:hypothetical protein